MQRLQRALMVSLVMFFAAARADAVTVFTANITTGQEPVFNPVTNSITGLARATPFGTATFTLNNAQTALSFTATIFNIDITGSQTADVNDNLVNAHIHASNTGVGATFGVVWGFFGAPQNNNNPPDNVVTPFANGVGGTFSGTWDLNEGNGGTTLALQLPNIFAGRSYINFHTVQNTGGEIRGAIGLVPEPSTALLLGLGLLGIVSAYRRRRR